MGSFSVYCSISNISITSGQKCVLLPLKKRKDYETYLPYLPATLPIFGEYDDYGSIEQIEKDKNTELIEEHFGVSIDEFTSFIIDGGCTYHRKELDPIREKMHNYDECKEWPYMWIDRGIYDFLAKEDHGSERGKGCLEFGDVDILNLLGFTYVGENIGNNKGDPKRYKYHWTFQGKNFHSDGTWLYCGKSSIFTFNSYSSLSEHIAIPEDKKWIGEKTMWQLWEHLSDRKAKENLLYIIDVSRFEYSDMLAEMLSITEKRYTPPEPKTLRDKYCYNFRTYGNLLSELVTIRSNLHCMSGSFQPYILYLTPQCGDYDQHQVLLDKFAKINKSYITEMD